MARDFESEGEGHGKRTAAVAIRLHARAVTAHNRRENCSRTPLFDGASQDAVTHGSTMPRFAANLTFLFNEVPFLERFGEAAQAGFRAVEFASPYEYRISEVVAQQREHSRSRSC